LGDRQLLKFSDVNVQLIKAQAPKFLNFDQVLTPSKGKVWNRKIQRSDLTRDGGSELD